MYTTPGTGEREKNLYRGTQIIWYVFSAISALLLFRFALRLLGANPTAGFTEFIYSMSYIFTAPFTKVFPTQSSAANVFEWSTLLAVLVYWLVSLALIRLFSMGRTVSSGEAKEKLNETDQ